MFIIFSLLTLILILIVKYGKRIRQGILERWRFLRLVSQLPGPTVLDMFCSLLQFKLDREQFTSQMEAMFRKYAYKHDHGIMCCWLGYKPILFLTRSTSAKVIFESTTLIHKPDDYDIFKRLVGDGLLSASGQTWFKARRMLTPAFHFNILQKYIEVFNEQTKEHPFICKLPMPINVLEIASACKNLGIKVLLEKLEEHCDSNKTFDLLPYLRRYGMDAIAETAMGVTIDVQNGRNNDQYYEALRMALTLMWARIRYPWFWFAPIRWLYRYDQKLDYYCNICKKLTSQIIAIKKKEWEAYDHQPSMEELSASGKKRLAFMDLLFSIRNEYKLSDEDIRGQVDMFMAAVSHVMLTPGSDAVTAQIGFNLFALGHRQHYQDKVYEEIKRVLGETERDVTVDDVHELKYLHQCICETGRITPNVVLMGRKLTHDVEICGYTVPAGITCAISPFAIMRDPKHYDTPEEYNPEHFAPDRVAERDPFAFVPFSAGIRNCIGHRFAVLEMTITLAYILRRYRVISMLPEKENMAIPEFSLKPSKGFPIRLERR